MAHRRGAQPPASHGFIVIPAAARVNSAAGGGTPAATGGRDDHVQRTRSLSRRALGGDRDPGWLHRLRPRGAHPRDAGRQPSRAAGGRRRVPRGRHLDHAFRRHAGGADPGRYRLSRSSHHHLVPDLRAGGRHLPVLRQHRRTVAAARGLGGGAARGRHRQHALCRHPRAVRQFRDCARYPDDPAVGLESQSSPPMAACAPSWPGRTASG